LDDKYFLGRDETALLIIDIQERLAAVMQDREKVVGNCLHLIEAAKLLGLPILVTEQYPKGLGGTTTELQAAVPHFNPIEKLAFDCCGEPAFMTALTKLGRKKIIVAGMETHVCVLQTATSLLREGYAVHVVRDAVCSRTDADRDVGVEYMRDAGAVITGTETALFQLLRTAGTAEFKAISQRIK
jgi:nicotinamidase-related amidase